MSGDDDWAGYNYDIYAEEEWNNEDEYEDWNNEDEYVDPYNENEYGEGSSNPIPRHASGRLRRKEAAEAILNVDNETYMNKEPCHTSAFTGAKWIAELNVGHPKRMYQAFRMSKTNFLELCELLESRYGLQEAERISVQEQVAIFLWIVGQRANNRSAQERFQRSGETISRRFHNVLDSLVAMAIEWVRPWPWPRKDVHKKIKDSPRYFPHFQGAIGAIDGTHIKCHPKPDEIAKWIGRKGYSTQNIMAACDFDMCFTFVESGWEGSAHDTRIFYAVIRDPTNNFPHPCEGEYYLVDAGYPNIQGFLAPYKGCTYHVPDWRRGVRARNNFEMFNKIHSSLRCTIERTFGVWKARWPMICDMPVEFSMETQNGLVAATMAIHNFIRRRNLPDIPFGFYDTRPEFMPYECGVETTAPNGVHGHTFENDDGQMNNVRAQIRDHIVHNHIS